MDVVFYSPTMLLCLFIIVIFSCFYTYMSWTFNYWKRRGVICMEPLPLIGNYDKFILDKVNRSVVADTLYKKNTGVKFFGLCHYRTPVLIIRDPSLINRILTTDFNYFEDRLSTSSVTIFNSLLVLPGEKWKHDRDKLSPLFGKKLETLFGKFEPALVYLNDILEPKVANDNEINMCEVVKDFTKNLITLITFGMDLKCMNENERVNGSGCELFRFSFRSVMDVLAESLEVEMVKNVQNILGISLIPEHVEVFYKQWIKEWVAFREKNKVHRSDFLQLLSNLKNKDGNSFDETSSDASPNDSFLVSNALMFYKTGFKTITYSLSLCLLELSDNLDVQRKLREEILRVRSSCNEDYIKYDVLKQMKYMEKVISETLRKYPVTIGLLRTCTRRYQIPETDVFIEKNIPVYIPVCSIHKDPDYYPNPDTFDPERFSEDNVEEREPGTYLPFGAGPRCCLGSKFAIITMKVALVHLLTRYEFYMTLKTTLPVEFSCKSAFLAPKDGVWLKVKPIV